MALLIGCSASRSAPSNQLVTTPAPTETPAPISASPTQGKQICKLALSEAPRIKGVRLGMTAEEVLAVFPGSKDDPEIRAALSSPPGEFGVSELAIRPAKYEKTEGNPAANPQVGDVTRISMTLLDGRVYILQAAYNGPAHAHVNDFVGSFVADKKLPAVTDWQDYPGLDSQLKILTCAEFEIRVFAGGERGILNYVAIKDLPAETKFNERVKKWEEKANPTPAKQ